MPGDLSSVPETHMRKWMDWLPQAVLSLPHAHYGMSSGGGGGNEKPLNYRDVTYHIFRMYGVIFVNYTKWMQSLGKSRYQSFLNFDLILGKIMHMYTGNYTRGFCLMFCFFFTFFLWSHNSLILRTEQMARVHKLYSAEMAVSPP